ncbi:MAG TPA: DoxX family protein [Pseudonocardia sp.]|jgi:putative oxidoreductase
MIRRLPEPFQDTALLIARLLIGAAMFAYGWDKMVTHGYRATVAGFAKVGVPLPPVTAGFAGIVELVGGALLIIGAATAVVGTLIVIDMAGAILTTHQYTSVLAQDHGFALSGSILAGALLIAAVGAGRYSVDGAVRPRQRAAQTSKTI